MDEKYIKGFDSIVTFVSDLWETFGNPKVVSPLSLYYRLINHIKHTDKKAIGKVLSGFQQFFVRHEKTILNPNFNIPRDTVIKFGENIKIVIEIQKFIHKSDPDTKEIIRQHLVTISAILEPNKEKIDELEKRIENLNIDASTNEGNFITNIMTQAKNNVGNANDPVSAITGLLNSGVIQNMIVGLQTGVSTGQMDVQKLLGSMQSAIGALMPTEGGTTTEEIEEITDDSVQKEESK